MGGWVGGDCFAWGSQSKGPAATLLMCGAFKGALQYSRIYYPIPPFKEFGTIP